jgi:DNA-binding SARP family transcriptional activator
MDVGGTSRMGSVLSLPQRGLNEASTAVLRLTVLGGVTLRAPGSSVDHADRGWQRCALLCLLAAAGASGIPRELLLDLLWPGTARERARHSLDELVSRLRRETGAREIVDGSRSVALNAGLVAVDAWEFEAAALARNVEQATALYRGHFSDGARVPASADLQQRLDVARMHYQRLLEELLEFAGRSAQERGDQREALRWWRRLVDLDPLNERYVRELIESSASLGDHASAIRLARVHAALVREQLGVEPGPRILEWISRVDSLPVPTNTPSSGLRSFEAGTTARRVIERAAGIFAPRYRMLRVVEDGRLAVLIRAMVPSEREREVDFVFVQPTIASFVDERRFLDVFARACALQDRCLLPTLDYGLKGDMLYIVTSPRPAESLREVLRRLRGLPIPEVIRIAASIIRALAVAHGRGLVHGDLRPKHVGIGVGGEVVLSGLGIVSAVQGGRTDPMGTTAVAFGSPRYLSPEQLLDRREPDPRSDVYALGAVMHHMLVGEPPTPPQSTHAHSSDVVSTLTARRTAVPPELARLIARCLSLHPAYRFQHCGEAAPAIEALGRSPDGTGLRDDHH